MVRRVVTGHDTNGQAVVIIDEVVDSAPLLRAGADASVIWTSKGFPVDLSGNDDQARRPVATSEPDGTVFRVISYAPGVAPRVHRTESIDYAVVISGEIDMELDDSVVHLKAGDVLVQRGTIHNWVNRGSEPCVIAFVLIAAEPVRRAGVVLRAAG